MLSKRRWALNPRKWFGSITSTARKRDKNVQIEQCVVRLPPPPPAKPTAPLVPRILTSRSKTKITPTLSNNDPHPANTKNMASSSTQLQLLASTMNQEKSSGTTQVTTTVTVFRRANTLIPTRHGPSIQKRSQHGEELSIDTKRRSAEVISCNTSKFLTALQSTNTPLQRSTIEIKLQSNVPQVIDPVLLDRPRSSLNNCPRKSSASRISHSPSPSSLSIDDNDARDGSSSSGVFTDERADVNVRENQKASRDTLSTLDALSVESIDDSQTSLNQNPSRQPSCQYRLPLTTFQTNENRSARQRSGASISSHHRARSAENILKDTPGVTPFISRTRQSSAAIVKKIEKRHPPGRSSSTEKISLVRVTNDTYRLSANKDEHLYRRQRRISVVSYPNHDDSLPAADDEESYATLPRTSSTEQLSSHVQSDLRAIVDDCLRPVAAAMSRTSHVSKTHHRSKRSHTNSENMQIDIEDITDRLLSSIDCSTYAQYQRCF